MAGSGLPVPSSQIVDIKANAENFDTFLNSNDATFTNRESPNGNVTTKTLSERLKELGYLPPATYGAGIQFTEQDKTKTISRPDDANPTASIQYAPHPSSLPFTTSGTWGTPGSGDDLDKFFLVQGLTPSSISTYTDLVFDSVSAMISGSPPIGSVCSTGNTIWKISNQVSPVVISTGVYANPLTKIFVTDLGADRTGAIDSTLPWQETYDLCEQFSPKKAAGIPPGTYRLGELSLKPGVSTYASGKSDVFIVPTSDNLTHFTLDLGPGGGANMDIVGLTFQNDTNINVNGFDFIGCNRVNIFDVAFNGMTVNFRFDLGGWNRVINCETSGGASTPSGAFWVGSSDDTKYGNVFSVIENYQVRITSTGSASPACEFRRAVAMKITNLIASSDQFSGTMALVENDCQGLMFTDCSSVGFGVGLWLRKGSGIDKDPVSNSFTNFEFDQNNTNAALIEAGHNNRFNHCHVTSSDVATNTQAIVLREDSYQNRFYDCHVTGYYSSGGTGWLFDKTDGNILDGCVVSGSETGVSANGTGHSDNKLISCDLSQDIGIAAISGDWANADNKFINVLGNIPAVNNVITPPVPVSGVAQKNDNPVKARLYVAPNTLISFQVNDGAIVQWTSELTLTLYPSDSIKLFYTGAAPTWTWVGEQ